MDAVATPAIISGLILAFLAGLLHVGFFVMETVLWDRPRVHRIFGVKDPADAAVQSRAMANLGFYNLFLGLGAMAGAVAWWWAGFLAVVIYACLFMVGAALVLIGTSRRMWRGALVQGLLPLIALVLLVPALAAL